MKRRFLLGSLGLALLTLRSQASQILTPQKGTGMLGNKNDESNTNNLPVVDLGPGAEFKLPKQPSDGEYLIFKAQGDLSKNAAVIRANGSQIMGKSDDLEVDLNVQFTLVYSDKHKSWGLA